MLNLFYVGDEFYSESGTIMSSIYEVGTFHRSDWVKVQVALRDGQEVHIRQADGLELKWAYANLRRYKQEREKRGF